MAITNQNKALYERMVTNRLKAITIADLDAVYSKLTNTEKQMIIDAVSLGTNQFQTMLMNKFKPAIEAAITSKIEAAQVSGKIDLADVQLL